MKLARRRLIVAVLVAAAGLGSVASCTKESPSPEKPGPTAGLSAGDVWRPGRAYVCRRAKGPITIDAEGHPEQWNHAMVIKDFIVPISHEPAKSQTVMRMLWDDEYLYVHGIAYDVDLRGTLTGRTARLWTEDAVELFLKPPQPESGYYEFEISPTNVLLDLEIPIDRHTTFQQRAEWESGSRTAIAIRGTIEKPEDDDEHYRLLMAIPWEALNFADNRPPKPGDAWKFIFCRCDLSKRYEGEQELSACIPLPKVDFHMYEIYPEIRFEE